METMRLSKEYANCNFIDRFNPGLNASGEKDNRGLVVWLDIRAMIAKIENEL